MSITKPKGLYISINKADIQDQPSMTISIVGANCEAIEFDVPVILDSLKQFANRSTLYGIKDRGALV